MPFVPERDLFARISSAEYLHPRLDVSKLLVHSSTWRTIGGSEDELCFQVPVRRDTPLSGDALRDTLLVVLQAAAEAFVAKRGPGYDVMSQAIMNKVEWALLLMYCAIPLVCSPHSGKPLIKFPSIGGMPLTASGSS